MKEIHTKRSFWLILILASVLACITSLYIGLQQSVWFDEAYSIVVAEHSWSEIVHLTAQDVHPPVYYWILKVWMTIFGSGELALRSMSALFLGLSVGAAGLLLRKLFGTKVALSALPFLVFAPFLLRYGFEIRMYSLATLIGISATFVLVSAVEETQKKKRWLLFILYALLVALGMYTLYFMALIWIAHLVWLAWLAYKQRRREILVLGAAAYALALSLFIPWLPVFLDKTGGDSLSPVTHQLDLKNLYGILTFLFFYQPPWEVTKISALASALVIGMIMYISWRAIKNANEKERSYLALLAMYFVVPVLTLIVVTYSKPIYIERYVAHIAIGIYALLGVLAALALRSKEKVTYLVSAGLIVMLLFGCISLWQSGNYNFQRLHMPSVKLVSGLLASCKEGAVIFADGPQIAVELDYYIDDCPIYFFNETLEMGGGFAMLSNSPLRVADASELPETKDILHIYYDTPKRSIPNTYVLEDTKTIDAVSVARYTLGSQ